jgi:hypothetical protein
MTLAEFLRRIIIAGEFSWRGIGRKGFNDLLRRPRGRRDGSGTPVRPM